MVKVTVDASCLGGLGGGGATYDDTEVINRIKALEGRTDNFVSEVTVSREGNKVKLTYTRVDGTSSEVEFDDKDTISIAYDDTALKERVTALEAKEDKDTVYDDTELKGRVTALEEKVDKDTVYDDSALKARVEALEAKPDKDTIYDDSDLKEQVNDLGSSVASALHDISEIRVNNESRFNALENKEDNDKQTLSLEGNTLSISNGNSVTIPVGVGKEFTVTSDTEGVTVTKSEAEGTTTYNVNMDNALDKFYKKAETYTKTEVDNLLTKQEDKATDLTVYRGTFTDRTKVKEGEFDAPVSPRVTLTYSSSTGVGIFKIDFKVVAPVAWRDVIAKLPSDAPVPVELVESQVWVGDNNTSVWIEKGSRDVKIFGVSDSKMFNKRIIISIPGIFKKA
jgi:hypothetical protein|nr:MAG TPA: hypothetical protein [Caudoviricetes sp.]